MPKDWNTEVGNLRKPEDRNWWKASEGKHKIKFLSDGEEYEYEWSDKVIQKVRFEVEINGEKYDWGVTKGVTENSLYGQIAIIGKRIGSLVGTEITLLVKGKEKDTTYIVMEALTDKEPVSNEIKDLVEEEVKV